MAPRTEFNTEQVRTKARKDLLYLLEGVSKTLRPAPPARARPVLTLLRSGPRQEERGP